MTTPGGLSLIIHSLIVAGCKVYEFFANLVRWFTGKPVRREPAQQNARAMVHLTSVTTMVAYVIFVTLSAALIGAAVLIVQVSWRGENNWYYLSRGLRGVEDSHLANSLEQYWLPGAARQLFLAGTETSDVINPLTPQRF